MPIFSPGRVAQGAVCLLGFLAAVVPVFAAPFVKDLAPPAQAWSFQKAMFPQEPPAEGWEPLAEFRNLIRPEGASEDWNSVWYETTLTIPAEARDRSVWLSFQHIRGVARIYLDDKFVKEVVRPDWEVDISEFVAPGKSAVMKIFVTRSHEGTEAKPEDDLIVPTVMKKRYSMKLPRALGLMGRVEMILRGKQQWLSGAWVESIWNPRSIKVHVEAGGTDAKGLQVSGEIYDSAGKLALKLPPVPFDASGMELSSPWEKVIPWELGRGQLYTLRVRLTGPHPGRVVDEMPPVTFGFREVRVEGKHILINGAPAHWRLSPIIWFDTLRRGSDAEQGSVKAIDFLSSVGYNVLEVQPHSESFWSRDHGPWPVYDEALLDEADRRGIGLTIGGAHFTKHWLDYGVRSDAAVRAQYRKEFAAFIKRYRNHPSILTWVGAMNYFDVEYGARANAPWGMGTEPTERQQRGAVHGTILNGERIMESVDPTRPAYAHHGGNSGSIASSNQHMCMTPISELERWPSEWAEKGTKPWIAVEFAIPYWADFWMKNRNEQTGNIEPLGEAAITEFAALTLGDEAYEMESEQLRKKLTSLTRANTSGHGSEKVPPGSALRVDGNILDQPSVRAVFAEYGRRVNRAWRTWQVTGWSPWLLSWGLRYRGNPQIFMPDVVEAYRESTQPLLAYIGGAPDFFLRQGNYRAGEAVEKSAVVIWDGPGKHELQAKWEAVANGKILGEGKFSKTLEAGSVTKFPFSFLMPETEQKMPVTITLQLSSTTGPGTRDEMKLTVWPADPAVPDVSRNLALFDPAGESAWVTALHPAAKNVDEASIGLLEPAKTLLVMGRRSLAKLDRLPYTEDQIARGLRVVLLEQTQADLRRLGLRSAEWGIRQGIAVQKASPVFAGLEEADFRDWRGSATLLAEVEDFRWWPDLQKLDAFNPARSARWGTHGNVSSVQIETPARGHFLPLMRCGFDMAYSPLLEWRHGQGGIWFCQVDLTGRVPAEPAASRLAANLFRYAAGEQAPADKALWLAGISEPTAGKINGLGFRMAAGKETNTISIGQTPAEAGFWIAGEKGSAAPVGTAWTAMTAISAEEVAMPEGTVPPPNLRRFRMTLDVLKRESDSAVLALSGTGEQMKGFIGVPLAAADGPYSDQVESNHARLTRWRIRQLYGWMFSMAGVASSPEVAGRITSLSPRGNKDGGPLEKEIELLPLQDVKISQAIKIPGLEQAALLNARDLPELVFSDQKTISASKDAFSYGGEDATGGFIDLAKLLDVQPSSAVMAVVTARVYMAAEKELTVRLGADYWGCVTLDGEEILRMDEPSGAPVRDAVRVRVRFKAGDNLLAVRVVSGSLGFGCWLDVDESSGPLPVRTQSPLGVEPFWGTAMLAYDTPGFSLYAEPMRKRDDPYAWKSW
jgi:beta-galactosidase